MASIASKRQLDIFEVRTADGGVGLQFGSSPVFLGHDEADLMRLLAEVFVARDDDTPVDGELYDLAHAYLDPAEAQKRQALIREAD